DGAHVPARDPPAEPSGSGHRHRDHRAADVRRLLHQLARLRIAVDHDGRQRDRVLSALRLPQGGRRVAAADDDGLLPGVDPPGRTGGGGPMRRRPVLLATLTWLYVVWSLAPVLIAVQ